jgi:hypothetical protein
MVFGDDASFLPDDLEEAPGRIEAEMSLCGWELKAIKEHTEL